MRAPLRFFSAFFSLFLLLYSSHYFIVLLAHVFCSSRMYFGTGQYYLIATKRIGSKNKKLSEIEVVAVEDDADADACSGDADDADHDAVEAVARFRTEVKPVACWPCAGLLYISPETSGINSNYRN